MRATKVNMDKYYRTGVLARSVFTGETCSANPGDYWHFAPEDCLKDSEGNDMELVKVIVTTTFQPIQERE